MRRSTSALTTTILGAVLSASTVSAQQSLPSTAARRAAPATTTTARRAVPAAAAAPTFRLQAADDAEPDPGFGMAAARGPRYLLHNGLDYIEYQEYGRALRYLREAEKRQGELNKAEKLKLTQAIERAQRGLRESLGSERAYALSDRDRQPAGIVAAPSRTQIAAAAPAPRDAAVSPARSSTARREGDDQGEPIRLTAGEAPAGNGRDDAERALADARAGLPPIPGAPSPLPDVPQAPAMPRLDVAADQNPAPSPIPGAALDLADAPPVTPIQFGAPDVQAAPAPATPAPAVEAAVLAPSQPLEAASFGVGAAVPKPVAATPEPVAAMPEPVAATPEPAAAMPELAAAGPAAASSPIEVAPASVDESVTLSTSTAAPEPAEAPAPAPIMLETPDEAAMPAPSAIPPLELEPPALPPVGASTPVAPAPASIPAMADEPQAPRVAALPAAADLDLPALPDELQDPPLPDPAAELPSLPSGPSGAPVDMPLTVAPPTAQPSPAPLAEPVPAEPVAEAVPADPLAEPVPAEPVAEAVPAEPPAEPVAAPVEVSTEEAPSSKPAPAPVYLPAAEPLEETPAEVPAPAPAPEAESVPAFDPAQAPTAVDAGASTGADAFLPARANPVSSLSPELQSRVDEVARKMEEDYRVAQSQPAAAPPPADAPYDPNSDLRSQTQIDISRAPSPAEARPIRAIPVPEDWVPLGARDWSAQRKYWAAAATCHMPLYFQDPMLERYGHSVERFVGPLGRFMAYPVDHHTESTQRNQIAQPFASIGLFAGQILALPYNMIMDPPWEAQYDLGYWRPGDKIPTDLYWLPTHGTGPPLRGKNY